MARSRSGARRRQRDVSTIARHPLLPPVAPLAFSRLPDPFVLALEDRREFFPARRLRPAASIFASDRDIVPRRVVQPSRRFKTYAIGREVFSFRVPDRVALCVRRKRRREVLFAYRRTGRGSRSPRRRNEWSDIACR